MSVERLIDRYSHIPQSRIRNFAIIAHIDHGKSTLADRMLEFAGNIDKDAENKQVLDNLEVERQRGITVRSQTATMLWTNPLDDLEYLINLVDTPGHVDFSYEVSRSLSACQGALLLVDAAQGIQAQTLANYRTAQRAGLTIIPVLTKLDLPNADPDAVEEQVKLALDLTIDEVVRTSAKSGLGVEDVFLAITEHVRPPPGNPDAPMRALLFDSQFESYRGVVASVRVMDGTLRQGDKLMLANRGTRHDAAEVGLVTPQRQRVEHLSAGQVGYLIANIKNPKDARVGDTFVHDGSSASPLPGFMEAKPMVYASLYPVDEKDFSELITAVERLTLNDPSVTVERERSGSLGMGLRCGFLGLLHMDVFHERLAQEYAMPVVITAPMVPYFARMKTGETVLVERPADLPTGHQVDHYLEPTIKSSIVTPAHYLGAVLRLLTARRGVQEDMNFINDDTAVLHFTLPWQEVATDFYDRLKSITQGYASFDYEPADPQPADVVRVDLLINGEILDELSFVAHRRTAEHEGKRMCKKLKEVIRRQLFEVIIQASVGVKVFSRERIPPYRKDVLNKSGKLVGGGDETRKKKLLEQQKAGKKRLKQFGKVEIPQEAFRAIMERSED